MRKDEGAKTTWERGRAGDVERRRKEEMKET